MAGYRRIPISPPEANNISLLAATDSISIPWDKYQEGMGNIYLDINPTGDPQITVGSDLNPLIQERSLDIKIKPVLSKAQFGPISSPVLRVIQNASVYVYKLELFNSDDLPEGTNLESATPFWTEDMGLGPINSGDPSSLASGGEFNKKIYYCEYRNDIRTKAHLVTNSWHNQYKYNWFTSQVTSQGLLSIITASRGIVIGAAIKGLVDSYYDPLEDSTFDWHDEYTDPYPRVSLDFYISQEANNIVNYKVTKWEVTKYTDKYWPPYYLPVTKGDGYTNYLRIESQYQRIFTSGSSQYINNDISGDECSVEKDGVWGTYSRLLVNKYTNKVYFVEDNPNNSTFEFTITLVLESEYSQEVRSNSIPIIQAPNDGLVKVSYGLPRTISGIGNGQDFESSAYPK